MTTLTESTILVLPVSWLTFAKRTEYKVKNVISDKPKNLRNQMGVLQIIWSIVAQIDQTL